MQNRILTRQGAHQLKEIVNALSKENAQVSIDSLRRYVNDKYDLKYYTITTDKSVSGMVTMIALEDEWLATVND